MYNFSLHLSPQTVALFAGDSDFATLRLVARELSTLGHKTLVPHASEDSRKALQQDIPDADLNQPLRYYPAPAPVTDADGVVTHAEYGVDAAEVKIQALDGFTDASGDKLEFKWSELFAGADVDAVWMRALGFGDRDNTEAFPWGSDWLDRAAAKTDAKEKALLNFGGKVADEWLNNLVTQVQNAKVGVVSYRSESCFRFGVNLHE